MKTDNVEDFAPRPFADVVRELAAGQTYNELTDVLGQIVAGVIKQRRPGSLTLKLKIMPNGENSVRITDAVDAKIPASPRSDTVFFAEAGALVREDPRQAKMELRSVETERKPLKEVATPPRELKQV